ncbi:MAG: hypothetical protein QOC89_5232 [Paraburkholderia sp.]|uniref:lysozyme inhibitor LprI family protein n=1 Tax=Paraburkholderia sp. TaxID=1926495 RepID=UPI002AFF8E31|nr:hypothetical protein [Paraburkholderia sp.]MEA3087535.1 hypothetical protein [Paraburkholderia sp.]
MTDQQTPLAAGVFVFARYESPIMCVVSLRDIRIGSPVRSPSYPCLMCNQATWSPTSGGIVKRKPYRWIGRSLRQALLVSFLLGSVSSFAASFDCNRARLPDEKAICASRHLSERDVEMAVRYQMLTGLVAMGTRGDMQDEQQAWLKTRQACGGNQACLDTAYRNRIQRLKDEYATLASRAPF